MLETDPLGPVRFRIEVFDRLVEPLGYGTDAAKARFLGVPRSVLWKLRNGRQQVSAAFIAAVKNALPRIPVEDLFEFPTVGDQRKAG